MRREEEFEVVHVEYVSDRSVDEAAAAREPLSGSVEFGAYDREVAPVQDLRGFERRAKRLEGATGFRILTLDHGAYLALYGPPRKVLQYSIGNPLIAATVVRQDARAALNVTVRRLIYEGRDGEDAPCL
jgi:hypothetical protein